MRPAICLVSIALSAIASAGWTATTGPRGLSGVYPHLAMFNDEDECGTGAVVPWAGRLWVVTYAPHKPLGSTDRLYEITPDLEQIIRPESIGGTPANRMIHRESQQLFIGPYVIDAGRRVRVIPYTSMFGRPTGVARHLIDPAQRVVFATMEEGFYDVNVATLEVQELWADEQLPEGRHAGLPGYHGKGFYSAQGRYVYANNGEHGPEALRRPEVESGCLAEWDGRADHWRVVRRNQFTEVTGPGGLEGNPPTDDRLWSIGWDHRSLVLMLLEDGRWHAYRLPKASHAYDGAHGWNTEWPRIRDIGEDPLLMTMHGSFWRLPRTFSSRNSAGLAPRSTYLKVIGDFARWEDQVVLGCDDTARSEFLNQHPLKGKLAPPGRSQSNLWFVDPHRLDEGGPPLGRGAVWLEDDVVAGVPSEPYLFSGFAHRSLHLRHGGTLPIVFAIEVDAQGGGIWKRLHEVTVTPGESTWVQFQPEERGAWVRLVPRTNAPRVTAFFHYRAADPRRPEAAGLFGGIARPSETNAPGGLLHARGGEFKTLRFVARNAAGELGCYDLDSGLRLRLTNDPAGMAWTRQAVALPRALITVAGGAALYVDPEGRRWRVPKGDPTLDAPGPLGAGRVCREVCTERNLLNVAGTFYELPAENAGGFARLRPIATHNRRISDFASYRGLLVISGVAGDAPGEHIIRSEDGQCALWAGAVDDLWAFGKPRGTLGVWEDAHVTGGMPSDACLATGYDRKRLIISHTHPGPVQFRVEADFTGTGEWCRFRTLDVPPGERAEYTFPEAFGAYWLRLVASTDTTASGTLIYD